MKGSVLILLLTALLSGCLNGQASLENRVQRFSDLMKNETTISVCEVSHCPAGRYAYMVISNVELNNPEDGRKIRDNIVSSEPHVRAVLDKVVSREVDAGFVYLTDARIESNKLQVIEIPREFSPLPQYGVTTIKDSKNPQAADQFREFLVSREGQIILQEYGFTNAVESPVPFENKLKRDQNEITLYAASSLTDAFKKIINEFEQETGVKVTVGYGSSGILRQKIEGGAPVDVFATASLQHAEMLESEGFIDNYMVFARNHLVIVVSR